VNVTVSPGNQTITLLDNGVGADPAANDGIYSAEWIPEAAGTFTLTFPGNDRVTVNVANPTIEVTPTSIDFGGVAMGSTIDKIFTVTNSGAGILSGTATTNAPFSIVSGGTYDLSAGQNQTVTVRFAPTTIGNFAANVNLTGGGDASVTMTGTATGVDSITPSSVDLTSPPANFSVVGSGFANLSFGLPVVNFTRNGLAIAQARATSGNSNSLVVPYPTNATSIGGPRPGLSVGPVTVEIYNQTGSNKFTLVGKTQLTVIDTGHQVSSITPNPIDLVSPPTSFTVAGNGFTNSGFGLPVVNFTRNGLAIAQARASSGTSTNLTVPYPTNATSIGGPRPGLSAGPVTIEVYNQTGANSFSLVGTTSLTVNDTRVPTTVTSINPNVIDLASPPASFAIAGSGFTNSGFGLPVVNFTRNGLAIAQARASSGTSTNLTVPYPTNATSIGGPRPGLSAGPVTIEVYNQTGANSFSLVGTTSLTVNDTRTLSYYP
jgi:hypothetical protein